MSIFYDILEKRKKVNYMFDFLKKLITKSFINKASIDLAFYAFILFGLPSISIIAYVYQWSLLTASAIFAVSTIVIISAKSYSDSSDTKKIFFKDSK